MEFQNAVEEIIRKYGREILGNEKKFLSVFMDLYPKQEKELFFLKELYNEQFMRGFLTKQESKEEEKLLWKVKEHLVQKGMGKEDQAAELINSFAAALQLRYRLEKKTSVQKSQKSQSQKIPIPPVSSVPPRTPVPPKPIQEKEVSGFEGVFTGIFKKLCGVLVFFSGLGTLGCMVSGSVLGAVIGILVTVLFIYGAYHKPMPRKAQASGMKMGRRIFCTILSAILGIYFLFGVLPMGIFGILNTGVVVLVLFILCLYGAWR